MPRTSAAIREPKTILQALVILMVSLAVTLAAWRWTAQQGGTLEAIRFRQYADAAVGDLRDRMEAYREVLLGGVAFIEASGGVGREQWRSFVDRLEPGHHYPGTQGIGFAQRVPAEQWQAHEAAVRAEGFPDYRITPPGGRDDAFPIVFLEPFAGANLRAFGYDMFAEPVRRQAMARARDTDEPTMTGRVVLVQEEDGHDAPAGVLLYLPVYDGPVATVEARRAALRGFVYSPLRMGDLVHGIFNGQLRRLCIEIHDQGETLFADAACRPGHFVNETPLDLFGRRWMVRVQSTPVLDREIASRRSKLILGSGAVISLLLVWAVVGMLVERRLRLALGNAMDEVEAARAEAAGAAAAKTRFMAAASHDLRQPLQSLGLYLHLLAERKGAGVVERSALQAYDATARLVEAMFDAAALESGSARPVLEPVAVGELVERIVAESRAEAEGRGLYLRGRTCPATVMTDKVMLERILRNLISNALKYTASGGVLVACRRTPGVVRIKVADSGPGIPADKRQLIFEDFYQLENPERDPRKGLGLGLATVARTARALGFGLRVLSREGKGSTFVVEMPEAKGLRPAAG